MTLSPGTGLRFAIIGLSVLIAMQLLIAASTFLAQGQDFRRPGRPVLLEQTAAAVKLMDTLQTADRRTALRAMNSPFIRFTLLDQFPEDTTTGMLLPRFRPGVRALRRFLPPDREFKVYRNTSQTVGAQPFQRGRRSLTSFMIVVRLADGSALAVAPSGTFRKHLMMNMLATVSALIGVACLVLLIWAGLATARPLGRMAEAANRFADDLAAPAMAEKGPRPIRDLARAFNNMQAKIRGLVSERTTTLAAVAHDFRTYLTRLRLRAEFIAEKTQREKALRDLDEMATLVEDTLLFARAGADRSAHRHFDLGDLVDEIVTGQQDLGHDVQLAGRGPGDAAPIHADRTAVKRALANLVDNGVRYGETVEIRIIVGADTVQTVVRDNGPGVPEAMIERLTDPFFRLEGSRSRGTGGAGLGLAITQRLIEGSEGTLSLRNHPQGGLEAMVSLPLADPPSGPTRPPRRAQAESE